MKRIFFVCILSFVTIISLAQDSLSAFKQDVFVQGKDSLPYRILFPKNYDPTQKYPLLIFLHGAGERGSDNASHLKYVAGWMQQVEEKYPSIIIAPQCPENDYWAKVRRIESPNDPRLKVNFTFYPTATPTVAMSLLESLTKKWQSEKFVDKNKIYIGGLSMGGIGTYEMLIRKPINFAAAFVICGGTNIIALKQKMGKTPLWIFHGSEDPIVSVDYARQINAMLLLEKHEVKYTEYAGVGHDSWLRAFQEPDLIPWIFGHGK